MSEGGIFIVKYDFARIARMGWMDGNTPLIVVTLPYRGQFPTRLVRKFVTVITVVPDEVILLEVG